MKAATKQQGFAMRGGWFLRWTRRLLLIAGTLAVCYVAITLLRAKLCQEAAGKALEEQIAAQ
jgi:hypothetical protein